MPYIILLSFVLLWTSGCGSAIRVPVNKIETTEARAQFLETHYLHYKRYKDYYGGLERFVSIDALLNIYENGKFVGAKSFVNESGQSFHNFLYQLPDNKYGIYAFSIPTKSCAKFKETKALLWAGYNFYLDAGKFENARFCVKITDSLTGLVPDVIPDDHFAVHFSDRDCRNVSFAFDFSDYDNMVEFASILTSAFPGIRTSEEEL